MAHLFQRMYRKKLNIQHYRNDLSAVFFVFCHAAEFGNHASKYVGGMLICRFSMEANYFGSFKVYTIPIGRIIRSHDISFHIYMLTTCISTSTLIPPT